MKKLIAEVLGEFALPMSFVKERNDYHPEYSLLQHTLTVMDNVAGFKYNELTLVALFHDLGKIDTYKIYKNSYGHEITSAWIVGEWYKQISKYADFDIVWWLVRNHIRAARVLDGNCKKHAKTLKNHQNWELLKLFTKCDDMLNINKPFTDDLLHKDVFVTTNEGELVSGKCNFIGFNYTFSYQQVTIGRTPIQIKNLNQVCSYYHVMSGKWEKQ